MHQPTPAQLILRGGRGQMRVSVHWPTCAPAGTRPPAAVLFSEEWIAGIPSAPCDVQPGLDELVLVAFWRASSGYEQGVEDACRVVEWTAAHAADLGADPRRLRVGGSAPTLQLVADVLARTGAAISPTPRGGRS